MSKWPELKKNAEEGIAGIRSKLLDYDRAYEEGRLEKMLAAAEEIQDHANSVVVSLTAMAIVAEDES